MLPALWSGIGGKMAEHWAAALFSPAFAFWATGLIAWSWSRGGSNTGLAGPVDALIQSIAVLPAATQAVLAVFSLLVVTASGVAARQLTLPVLRLLEGYWPRLFDPLRRVMITLRSHRIDRDATHWRDLARRPRDTLSETEYATLLRLS